MLVPLNCDTHDHPATVFLLIQMPMVYFLDDVPLETVLALERRYLLPKAAFRREESIRRFGPFYSLDGDGGKAQTGALVLDAATPSCAAIITRRAYSMHADTAILFPGTLYLNVGAHLLFHAASPQDQWATSCYELVETYFDSSFRWISGLGAAILRARYGRKTVLYAGTGSSWERCCFPLRVSEAVWEAICLTGLRFHYVEGFATLGSRVPSLSGAWPLLLLREASIEQVMSSNARYGVSGMTHLPSLGTFYIEGTDRLIQSDAAPPLSLSQFLSQGLRVQRLESA